MKNITKVVDSIINELDGRKGFEFGDLDEDILDDIKDELAKLILPVVVSSVFLVQHKETLINYGLFITREKAENYINKNTDLFGIQEVKIA